MDKNQFQHLLKQTLDQEIEQVDLWTQIEQQIPARQPVRRPKQFTRLVLIAAILIFTATVTYGFYQRGLMGDPGVRGVQPITIGETKSIDGQYSDYHLTVTLDDVYADANRITVSYTVQGDAPTGERIMAYANPTLMTADGQLIESRLMLGGREENTNENGRYVTRSTINFIPLGVPLDETLELKLIVDVALSDLDSGTFPAPGMILAGSVDFTFEVPLIPAEVIDINQTTTSGDITLELQRLVITPSMMRLEMCYDLPPLEGTLAWSPFVTVRVGDEVVFSDTTETFGLDVSYDANSRCRGIVIPQNLHSGEWQIDIQRFIDFNGEYPDPIEGSWTFNLQ